MINLIGFHALTKCKNNYLRKELKHKSTQIEVRTRYKDKTVWLTSNLSYMYQLPKFPFENYIKTCHP